MLIFRDNTKWESARVSTELAIFSHGVEKMLAQGQQLPSSLLNKLKYPRSAGSSMNCLAASFRRPCAYASSIRRRSFRAVQYPMAAAETSEPT
jgi:hypothetical protein